MQFRDRVVLITGAAGGIGRPLCFRIGGEGGNLALVDRNAAALEKLQHDLKAAGIRAEVAVADVRNRAEVHEAAKTLRDEVGATDILIAGAGLCGLSGVNDLRVPQLVEILNVNFLGAVHAIEAVLPDMLVRGSGQIVGIASLAAVCALPFESAYCASKAALATYLDCLRPSLWRRGVKVTTIFPGFVRTPLLENLLSSGAAAPAGVIEPDAAAARIVSAIRRGSRKACFPRITSWLASASRWLPGRFHDRIMLRIAAGIPVPETKPEPPIAAYVYSAEDGGVARP